jgi:DNA polymerase (family 10)
VKRLTNAEIGEQLDLFAALLDLSGSSFYTSRAYRRAAETIRETQAPIVELVAEDRVEELRGIGPGIATRLRELVETGRIAASSVSGRNGWSRSERHSVSPRPTSFGLRHAQGG